MINVMELCKVHNGDGNVCWWACVGSTCPFRNTFSGHSDDDHKRVVKASQREVVAKAQSTTSLGHCSHLLGGK